jgi:hypothetical protein
VSDGRTDTDPYDVAAEELRRLARQGSDGRVACRLLGVANAWTG